MMNKARAAGEIVKAYDTIAARGETASLWAIWYAMEWIDMTAEELAAGVLHLARTNDDVALTPAMYPILFSTKDLELTVRFGGQDCNTLMIAR